MGNPHRAALAVLLAFVSGAGFIAHDGKASAASPVCPVNCGNDATCKTQSAAFCAQNADKSLGAAHPNPVTLSSPASPISGKTTALYESGPTISLVPAPGTYTSAGPAHLQTGQKVPPPAPPTVLSAAQRKSHPNQVGPNGLAAQTGWMAADHRKFQVMKVGSRLPSNSVANTKIGGQFNVMAQLDALDDQRAGRAAKEQKAYSLVEQMHADFEFPAGTPWITADLSPNPRALLPIHSCREYSYKKYFQFNAFQDVVRALSGDYRAIFDVAMNDASPVRITHKMMGYGPLIGDVYFSTYHVFPDQDQDMLRWNSFYYFTQASGYISSPTTDILAPGITPHPRFSNQCAQVDGGSTPSATCWWDTAIALEASHRSLSDDELAGATNRSNHFGDLIDVMENAIEVTWANACRTSTLGAGSTPVSVQTSDVPGVFVAGCTVPKNGVSFASFTDWNVRNGSHTFTGTGNFGKPPGAMPKVTDQNGHAAGSPTCSNATIQSLNTAGSSDPNAIKKADAALAVCNQMDASAYPYKTITLKPGVIDNSPGVVAAKAAVAAYWKLEDARRQAGQPSCTDPNALTNPCTWSYKRFADLLSMYETTDPNGNPIPIGLSELATCQHFVPDFLTVVWDPKDQAYQGNHALFGQIWPDKKLWFDAYFDKTATSPAGFAGANLRPKGYWGTTWTQVEALFGKYEAAVADWAQFDADEKKFTAAVKTVLARSPLQTMTAGATTPEIDDSGNPVGPNTPGYHNALCAAGQQCVGQQYADGHDYGNPSLFGASQHYAIGWALRSPGDVVGNKTYPDNMRSNSPIPSQDQECGPGPDRIPCADEEFTCRYNGSMNAAADAAVSVFGTNISLLNTAINTYADDDSLHGGTGAHMDAHFSLLGSELVQSQPADASSQATNGFNLTTPIADWSDQEPNPPIDIPFSAGPIPMDLQAGVNLSAGIVINSMGRVGDSCNQTLPTITTHTKRALVPPAFALNAGIEPWIRVDGFVEVGVDLVFVKVGMGVDLEVIKLDVNPQVGVAIAPNQVTNAVANFGTTITLGLESLSGYVYAYEEIDYLLGTATFKQTIFDWSGLHASTVLYSLQTPSDMDAINYRFHPPSFPNDSIAALGGLSKTPAGNTLSTNKTNFMAGIPKEAPPGGRTR